MKVRIKVQPTGYISLGGGPLTAWPKSGSVVELPDTVAEDLISSGYAEKARLAKADPVGEQVESRPAPKPDEERRTASRSAAKKADSESA